MATELFTNQKRKEFKYTINMNELWSKTPFTFQLSMQNPEYNRVGISYPLTETLTLCQKKDFAPSKTQLWAATGKACHQPSSPWTQNAKHLP